MVAAYVRSGSSAYGSIVMVLEAYSGTLASVFAADGAGEIATAPAIDFGSSGFENATTGSPSANRLPLLGLGLRRRHDGECRVGPDCAAKPIAARAVTIERRDPRIDP